MNNSRAIFPKLSVVPDKAESKLQIRDGTFKTEQENHEVNFREGNRSL